MNHKTTFSFLLASSLLFACGTTLEMNDTGAAADAQTSTTNVVDAATPTGDEADAAPGQPDAPPAVDSEIPVWSLEDIQPMSPRFGQSYGLDAFPEKIVVAVLVDGF